MMHDLVRNVDLEDAFVAGVQSVIATEFEEKTSDGITTAILASIDSFGFAEKVDEEEDDGRVDDVIHTSLDGVDEDKLNQEFTSRCQMPLSDLLKEYGDKYDKWIKQPQRQPTKHPEEIKNELTSDDFRSRLQMPLSDLMAEYGEQNEDWTKEGHMRPSVAPRGDGGGGEATTANHSTIDAKQMSRIADSKSTHGNLNSSNGMLAHYDKAVVHLELVGPRGARDVLVEWSPCGSFFR